MKRLAKPIEALGMVLCGIGLFHGIFQNDMTREFSFLGAGIITFMIGLMIDRS